MHFYVAVFSAGTGVEILLNMVAAITLYMKVCNCNLLRAYFDVHIYNQYVYMMVTACARWFI